MLDRLGGLKLPHWKLNLCQAGQGLQQANEDSQENYVDRSHVRSRDHSDGATGIGTLFHVRRSHGLLPDRIIRLADVRMAIDTDQPQSLAFRQ